MSAPEDAAARMLYGTCCQLMGDSATFGRIYRDLAPQMEPRVTSGERSELVSMWLKYAAMFAAVVTCFYGALGDDVPTEIPNATNATEVVSTENIKDVYDRVMKMSLRDKFRYFLERQDVKEQLHRGAMRAVVIPLQWSREHKEQENLLIVRVKDDQTSGASVGKSLRTHLFAKFSPFENYVGAKTSKSGTNAVWNFNDSCRVQQIGLERMVRYIEGRDDISDLVINSSEQGFLVIGICFVNFVGESFGYSPRAKREFRSIFLRRVLVPDGAIVLTKEMLREEALKALEAEDEDDW